MAANTSFPRRLPDFFTFSRWQIYTGLGLGNPQDRDITGAAPFCTFVPSHDHDLQLYLALPHLTSPIGALVAAVLSHKRGRKATMWLGCLAFIVAKLLLVTSYSRSQVWAARTVTGVAAGLMHQVSPLCCAQRPRARRGQRGRLVTI